MTLREIEARLAGISVNEENLKPSSGLHKTKVRGTLASTRVILLTQFCLDQCSTKHY